MKPVATCKRTTRFPLPDLETILYRATPFATRSPAKAADQRNVRQVGTLHKDIYRIRSSRTFTHSELVRSRVFLSVRTGCSFVLRSTAFCAQQRQRVLERPRIRSDTQPYVSVLIAVAPALRNWRCIKELL